MAMGDDTVRVGVPRFNTVTGVNAAAIFAQDAERRNAVPFSVPLSDPRSEFSRLDTVFPSANVLMGTVHYVLPGAYSYIIYLDMPHAPVICTDLSPAVLPLSPKLSFFYPVGARVIVYLTAPNYGVIIGAATPAMYDTAFNFSPLLSGVGNFDAQLRQYVANILSSKESSAGVPSFAASRPRDLCASDYAITNALEGGFHTGLFETSIRQAPDCGVWMFLVDRLLRVVGRSIQHYSGAHEEYCGLDEREPYCYRGVASYIWEALGYYSAPDTLYTGTDDLTLQDGKGLYELEGNDDVVPFYRYEQYTGYMGRGFLQQMRVPPIDADADSTLVDTSVPPIVAKQHILDDGTILFESSKAIHLLKQPNIRSFKRICDIESPDGDSPQDTDAASEEPLADDACITDRILNVSRKLSPASFRERSKDFVEIEEDGRLFDVDVEVGDLSVLKTEPIIPAPPPTEIMVDERSGNVNYTPARAGISILDDGSVVIRGSCGEEIKLSGGNIYITAPGDVIMMPARSAITMAGDDIIEKAKNSVDIVAVSKDVHIKADKNLDVVGGLSGVGRVLIESTSTGYATADDVDNLEGEDVSGHGLWLKSDESAVMIASSTVYFRSPSESMGTGRIVLDAGDQPINIFGGSIYFQASTQITGAIVPYSPESAVGSVGSLFTLMENAFVASKDIWTFESVRVKSSVVADGSIFSTGGVSETLAITAEMDSWLAEWQENFASQMQDLFVESFWDDLMLAGESTLSNYVFSFRTSNQYGASRFAFDAPYWMELYSSGDVDSLDTWDEEVYTYQGSTSQLSFPGYDAWTSGTVMVPSVTLYDADSGKDADTAGGGGSGGGGSSDTPQAFYRIINPD
jgi:hypothetical protein